MSIVEIRVTEPRDPFIEARIRSDRRFAKRHRRGVPRRVVQAWDDFGRRVRPDNPRQAVRTREHYLTGLGFGDGTTAVDLDAALDWGRGNYPDFGGHPLSNPRETARQACLGPLLTLPRIELDTLIRRGGEAHDAWNEARLRIPAEAFVLTYETTGGRIGFGFVLSEGGAGYIDLNVTRAPLRAGPMIARGTRVFALPPPPTAPRMYDGADLTIGHSLVLVPLLIANERRAAVHGVEPTAGGAA
jgi:hypothetical protein